MTDVEGPAYEPGHGLLRGRSAVITAAAGAGTLNGTFRCTRAALRSMKETGGGAPLGAPTTMDPCRPRRSPR